MKKHGKILISWNDFIIAIKFFFIHWHINKRQLWNGRILDKPKERVCKALLRNLGEELWCWE
jgi:hypothetical protein